MTSFHGRKTLDRVVLCGFDLCGIFLKNQLAGW